MGHVGQSVRTEIADLPSEARLGGTEINALHRIEIHGLTRLPEIMVILHGQPTFR